MNAIKQHPDFPLLHLHAYSFTSEVHLVSKAHRHVPERAGNSLALFSHELGGNDFSSASESGGGYGRVRQCALNRGTITTWSLG